MDVNITASDGVNSTSEQFTLNVTDVNEHPEFTSETGTVVYA